MVQIHIKWKKQNQKLPHHYHHCGQRSLASYSPQGLKELNKTKCVCVHVCARTHTHTRIHTHNNKSKKTRINDSFMKLSCDSTFSLIFHLPFPKALEIVGLRFIIVQNDIPLKWITSGISLPSLSSTHFSWWMVTP